MSTTTDMFLTSATGPMRLLQELELRTGPVARLSRMLAKTKTLQTVIPNELLGGELLALLSNRLQTALLLAEDLSAASVFDPVPHISFSPQEETPAIAWDRSGPPATRLAAKTVTPYMTSVQAPERDRLILAPERGATTHVRPLPPAFQSDSSAHPQPEPDEPKAEPDGRTSLAIDPRPQSQALGRPRAESLLARQLRRYWQLSEPESVSTSPPDTPRAEDRQRPGATWPHPALIPSPTTIWPELIGRTAVRKVNHFHHHTHGAAEQNQQTIHADAPENVEIRNVFNIALPSQSDRNYQKDTQLAETIADILRDQALQHGIDLS